MKAAFVARLLEGAADFIAENPQGAAMAARLAAAAVRQEENEDREQAAAYAAKQRARGFSGYSSDYDI